MQIPSPQHYFPFFSAIMRLLQNRFCKKFLGILFFGERVYKNIHDEPKNKITTKFEAKDRFCNSLIIFTIASYFSFINFGFAAISDQDRAIDQQQRTLQQIERERENIIRQKNTQEIENIEKKSQSQRESENKGLDGDNSCQIIKEFIFSGNEKFSSKKLSKEFTNQYQNKCLTRADLKNIKKVVEDYYLHKGYVAARLYFSADRLNDRIIEIIIEEGKIENFKLQDNSKINDKLSWRQDLQKFFAFPFLSKNDVVNLRDIEQGLDQINRLSSSKATMNISPASSAGYSDIIINNQIDYLTRLSLAFDNSGNKNTGMQREKIILNQDNLLAINDNIYINYARSANSNNQNRNFESLYSAISAPFGYWNLGGSYSYANYLTTITGTVTTLKSSGKSEKKSYYIERVLKRGKQYKLSAKAELTQSENENYLEDIYLAGSSKNLSLANFYFSNILYLRNGSIYLQPKYIKGLKILGATKDAEDVAANVPHAQFEAFGLYGQLSQNFKLPKTDLPLNYQLTFNSLYSKNSLYSSEQFSIGDRYTVRGFSESSISGDKGYYINNDLQTNLIYFLPKKIINSPIFSTGSGHQLSIADALAKTSFGVFYDYGQSSNKIVDERKDKGYLSGAGLKLKYSGRYLNWDVTYSRGLHSPEFLVTDYGISKDNETIYFNLSLTLGIL